jgi:hypothetical protein
LGSLVYTGGRGGHRSAQPTPTIGESDLQCVVAIRSPALVTCCVSHGSPQR